MRIASEIVALQVSEDLTSEQALILVNNRIKKRNLGSIYLKDVNLNIPSIFTTNKGQATPADTNLTFSLASQTARSVFAAPTIANGTPSFRSLELADIPAFYTDLNLNTVNYWQQDGAGNISRAANKVLIGSSTDLGSWGFQVSSSAYFNNNAEFAENKTIKLGAGTNITFTDKRAVFPTSAASAFIWDLNNDSARIYAQQTQSDYIDLVFKITDNAATTTDRFVFWITNYTGVADDRYPLYMDGTRAIVNYLNHYNGGSGGSGATVFAHLKSGVTSVSSTNSMIYSNPANNTIRLNENVGIGTDANAAMKLLIAGSINNANSWGIRNTTQIISVNTSASYGFQNLLNTQSATFTLSSYTNYMAEVGTIGDGSTITTVQGFAAYSSLGNAAFTNVYGFRGQLASGTGRWNLYMDGTANNYMAGALGIGTTSLANLSLHVAKALTGGTTAYGVRQAGVVQSDVTSSVYSFISESFTSAASFNLTSYHHFIASQSTIGAGSTITNQYGFNANSTLTGATNNYGFYGNIASGTGRWNFYANGTAANYFAGKVFIANATDLGYANVVLQVTGSIYSSTLTASTLVKADANKVLSAAVDGTDFVSLAWLNNNYWVKSGVNLYYNLGHVGVGTTTSHEGNFKVGNTMVAAPSITGTTDSASTFIVGYSSSTWAGGELHFGTYNTTPGNYASWLQARNPTDYSVNRNLILQPNGGNLGIGTTSPGSILDIVSNAVNTSINITNTLSSATASSSIRFGNNTSSDRSLIFHTSSTYSGLLGADALHIYQRQNAAVGIYTNNALRLVVLGSGNVGIGTDSPANKLHVTDATGILLSYSDTANVAGGFRILGRAYSGNKLTLLMYNTNSYSNQVIYGGGTSVSEPATQHIFYTIDSVGSATAGTVRMDLSYNGELSLRGKTDDVTAIPWLSFKLQNGTRLGYVGIGSPSDNAMRIVADSTTNAGILFAPSSGLSKHRMWENGNITINNATTDNGFGLIQLTGGSIYISTIAANTIVKTDSNKTLVAATAADITALLGNGTYIQNQIAAIQTGNFAINGKAIIGGSSVTTSYKVLVDAGSTTGQGIYVNGTIYATGEIDAASDRNLKENLKAIKIGNRLNHLSAYSYNFIDGNGRRTIGVMAQDFEPIFPELVRTREGRKSFNYLGLAAVVLGFAIEIKKQVNKVEKKQSADSKKIKQLEKLLAAQEQHIHLLKQQLACYKAPEK